jgi:hypothetical protein
MLLLSVGGYEFGVMEPTVEFLEVMEKYNYKLGTCPKIFSMLVEYMNYGIEPEYEKLSDKELYMLHVDAKRYKINLQTNDSIQSRCEETIKVDDFLKYLERDKKDKMEKLFELFAVVLLYLMQLISTSSTQTLQIKTHMFIKSNKLYLTKLFNKLSPDNILFIFNSIAFLIK